MKLTADQIAQIKSWISKRGFTHTDVQYEIIDHVASAIEDKMEEKPKLSLEEAFAEVHKSFGIFGFSSIEDSISGRIRKQLFNAYLKAGKKLLTSRKLLFPLLIILSLLTFYQQVPQYFEVISQILLGSFVMGAIIFVSILFSYKRHIKNYLSFRIAVSFTILMAVNLFNIQSNVLLEIHSLYKIALYFPIIIIAFSIYYGTLNMIRKTEKLHELYEM
jgi:hypothetical protein